MINIAIIHTGRLEDIENHRKNNPSLFQVETETESYKLDFITSTWKEVFDEKIDLFDTHNDVQKITSKLIINERSEMIKDAYQNEDFIDYIKYYVEKYHTNKKDDDFVSAIDKSLHFVCNQHISQFYLLQKAISEIPNYDIYIKLRTDSDMNHVNMVDYISLLKQIFCYEKESRFNQTFLDWFDLENHSTAINQKLVHMKVMFQHGCNGFIKDQFFAFNKSKSSDINNNFFTRISKYLRTLEDESKVTGESLWYSLLSDDTYIINDDWNESIDSKRKNFF